MNLFVTGANGFLGGSLVRVASARGENVRGSTSNPAKTAPGIIALDWNGPVPPGLFGGVDVVIHCAHDFKDEASDRNVDGTEALARAALAAGVPRQIYVSSLSARAEGANAYGACKYRVEQRLAAIPGMIIVRPGTIVGRGGLFGKIVNLIGKLPVVPLLNGGKSLMYLIGLDDLTAILLQLAAGVPTGAEAGTAFNLYYATSVPTREVFAAVRKALGTWTLFLPVPVSFLLACFLAVERIGLALPVGSDNLRGYIGSQKMIHPAHDSLFPVLSSGLADPADLGAMVRRNLVQG